MSKEQFSDRYKFENENIIIEVAVKNSRQLFNERDPSPFRERDLDPQFVIYLVSAVEEFTLSTKMKARILTSDSFDVKPENITTIRDAIKSFFQYESKLAKAKLRNRFRTSRYFFLIGLITLIICLSLAQFIETTKLSLPIINIASVGLVIIGWVAMWHPIESLLYDWWPIHLQRQYFDKIALMSFEVELA